MLGRLTAGVERMRGRIALVALVAVSGLAAVVAGHAATVGVNLLKVRMGGSGAETRTVIELDGATVAKVQSDGATDRRIIILLPGVRAAQVHQGSGRGVVKTWMVDQVSGGVRLQMADERTRHRQYTRDVGEDPPDIRDWVWPH